MKEIGSAAVILLQIFQNSLPVYSLFDNIIQWQKRNQEKKTILPEFIQKLRVILQRSMINNIWFVLHATAADTFTSQTINMFNISIPLM